MKGFCLAHSFLSHDRLYKLYVLRTVPTVFSVQLSNYISRCDEFVGEVNSELEPFVLYFCVLQTTHIDYFILVATGQAQHILLVDI